MGATSRFDGSALQPESTERIPGIREQSAHQHRSQNRILLLRIVFRGIDYPALDIPAIHTGGIPDFLHVAQRLFTDMAILLREEVHVEFDSLEDEVLAHLDHEPAALRVTDVAVSDQRLRSVVPADVAAMDHSAGLITYAQSCPIRGKEVPHLVIQGKDGPVTILLMPEETIPEAIQLSGEHVNGVILPVGSGSIAIIGGRDERLEKIEQQVLKSVTWTT